MMAEADDANGIYFDRPPESLISALSLALGPASSSEEAVS